MTTERHVDLAVLASLLKRPLRIDEASVALKISPQEVLSLAQQAVDEGLIVGEGTGYVPGDAALEIDPPYVAYLAGSFAETLEQRGASGEAGRLFVRAGRELDAIKALVAAAIQTDDMEAATLAVELDPELGPVDQVDAGRIQLMLARHLRNQGDSGSADRHVRDSIRWLEGSELVDALGFAAAIASDLQEAQRAESMAAIGAGQAESLGRLDKAGSLLTLQGRELSRLGFSEEADNSLARGIAMLEAEGDRAQRFRGRMNAGWVAFDRGLLTEAEDTFDDLIDLAGDIGEPVTAASQLAYHSRALAAMGRINDSRLAGAEARSIAAQHGAKAIEFLVALGEAEGALAFQRTDDAIAGADASLQIAQNHLASWTNRALHYRAKAALLNEDTERAAQLLADARRLTSPGIDGWRVRNLIRTTELELARGDWPQREAEDLTDEFLQASQYLAAAELLTLRAVREKDAELGLQAAALAIQVGAPAQACLAVEAAGAWDDKDVAGAVGRLIRKAAAAMPEDWQDGLGEVPAFAHGLAAETEEVDDSGALTDLLSDVLTSAGLSGDVVLSPAQRRARGLVRRKARRRKTSVTTWIAAAIGAVALVVSLVALTSNDEPLPLTVATTVTTAPTTTTLPPVELRDVDTPDLGLFGSAAFRGGDGLTGVVDETAISSLTGRYWVSKPGGFFQASPVASGKHLYLGSSTNDEVYRVDLTTGQVREKLEADGRVLVSVAVGDLKIARGDDTVQMVVYVAEGGTVHGQSIDGGGAFEPISLDSDVSASPVIAGGLAIIGTESGYVYGLNSDGVEWIFPKEGEEALGPIGQEVVFADGVLYVIDETGELLLIEAESGNEICRRRFGQPPVGNPVVSGENLYIQTQFGFLIVVSATDLDCDDTEVLVQMSPDVTNPIAVNDGIVYSAEANRLFPFDPDLITGDNLASGEQLGPWAPYITESDITTAPVIAGDIVLVGTQAGVIHAVDLVTGEEVWRFDADVATEDDVSIQGALIVIENTVIAATPTGHLIAVAGD